MKAATSNLPWICCVLATACYTPHPLETILPAPSTRIVVELTDKGSVAMADTLGPGAREVEGVVSGANENEWRLQMLRVTHDDGNSIPWNRELIGFPRSVVASTAVVALDTKKTWLAAGVITIGAILMARAFNVLGAEDSNEDRTPAIQQSVVRGIH